MQILIKNIKEATCDCDALILPFIEGKSNLYDKLGPATSQLIKRVFKKEFNGKQKEVLCIPAPEELETERLVLVGLGKKNEVSPEEVRQAGGKTAHALRDSGMSKVALSTTLLSALNISPAQFVEGFSLGLYSFDKYRAKKDKKKIDVFSILSKGSQRLKNELLVTETISSSVWFVRDLINTPANDMTPTHLADIAVSLKRPRLSIRVLEKSDANKLGMGAYLSVAKGSKEPPKFIILDYKGAQGAPIVIIGKSITFDSGGMSLKPPDGMERMKGDMAGGATVLGIVKTISELKLPVRLIGILPATENLLGGSATRPGDVVRSIDGKTIEIINTDAEGRLVLADALGYAQGYKPRAIIDIATLTGACSIALGSEAIAMMGNDRRLMDKLRKAGNKTHERVWEMPLFKEYKEYIKSDIADIKNYGSRNGSLIASAYFLYEFAGKVPWVHLDIAGTAWLEKEKPYMPKGASGIGVRLLVNFIREIS
jgi:leucyl aminopeptidase